MEARRELQQALEKAESLVEILRRALAAHDEPLEIPTPDDLVDECARLGIPVVDGRYVRERHAASLSGFSRFTLRNRRRAYDPIFPPHTVDGATHYDLADIGVHRNRLGK